MRRREPVSKLARPNRASQRDADLRWFEQRAAARGLTLVVAGLLAASAGLGGCAEDETTSVDPPEEPPPVDFIDISTDTNRDGFITEEDNLDEAVWTVEHGAAFMPNIDDDNLDGVLDGEDAVINVTPEGDGDRYDLTALSIEPWPEVPADATGVISIDAMSVPHVRLFKENADGTFALLAGANSCDQNPAPDCNPYEARITADDIRAGVTLRLEGVRLVGLPGSVTDLGQGPVPWSGVTELVYRVLDPALVPLTTEHNPDGFDVVQLRVSPWIMFGNTGTEMDTIYSNVVMPAFVAGITVATDAAGLNYAKVTNWGDHWTEDYFQTGFVSIPWADGLVHGMRASMPRPWGRSNNPADRPVNYLAQSHAYYDSGYFVVYREPDTGSTYDSYGNHDLIPAHEGYPYGRIIHGSNILPETKTFYDAQMVQGPSLEVNTSWLIVGHVDEALSYVPAATDRGWKLLVGSPTLAREMLLAWQQQGFGDAQMFVGKSWDNGAPAAISIDEVLADQDLMADSQEAQGFIDGMVATVRAEIDLTDDEIIEIPFLFEADAYGLVAFNPGTVNSLVFNGNMVIPDPHGPVINGVDGFEQDLLDRLGTAANQLGADGQGMAVYFADDWDWYHVLLGEVHCGTNQQGPPSPEVKWWEAAQ